MERPDLSCKEKGEGDSCVLAARLGTFELAVLVEEGKKRGRKRANTPVDGLRPVDRACVLL